MQTKDQLIEAIQRSAPEHATAHTLHGDGCSAHALEQLLALAKTVAKDTLADHTAYMALYHRRGMELQRKVSAEPLTLALDT